MNGTSVCFNCTKPISRKDGTETTEHIPARSLFAGFSDEYKINRITVPCCYQCNNESSKALDEEFRNMIGAITNQPDLTHVVQNAVKSMFVHRKQFERLPLDQNGRLAGLVSFNNHALIDYQVKIFKGLFYHQYKRPLPLDYDVSVDSNHDGKNLSGPFIRNYLLKYFEYKHSGHPQIFKYILQPFREGFSQTVKNDLIPTSDDRHYVGLLVFNQTFASVLYASLSE